MKHLLRGGSLALPKQVKCKYFSHILHKFRCANNVTAKVFFKRDFNIFLIKIWFGDLSFEFEEKKPRTICILRKNATLFYDTFGSG